MKIRYDATEFSKMIEHLGEMFNFAEEPISEDAEEIRTTDPSSIIMVEAKSKIAKQVLRFFVEKDKKCMNKPLCFPKDSIAGKSKFTCEYIAKIINFLNIAYENKSIYFETRKDHLIKISNDDWEFIVAHRVDT